MTERVVYHVVPKGPEEWQVEREGGERATENFPTKDEAIAGAQQLLENDELGQIIIHKQDGTIQEERTYGEDPTRTPG